MSEGHARIQILTHPEWWQNLEAEPGEKVCQELKARSQHVWIGYRSLIEEAKRNNKMGLVYAPRVLPALFSDQGERLLMLWLEGHTEEAYVVLYCRFVWHVRRLVQTYMHEVLHAPARQVTALLQDYQIKLDPIAALTIIASVECKDLIDCELHQYRKLREHRNALTHGCASLPKTELSASFDQLARACFHLAHWGKANRPGVTESQSTTARMAIKQTNDNSSLLVWLKTHQINLELSKKSITRFENKIKAFALSSVCFEKMNGPSPKSDGIR